MTSPSARHFDERDIRVLADALEHDPAAVGAYVEPVQGFARPQLGELTPGTSAHVYQPEILAAEAAELHHELASGADESVAVAEPVHLQRKRQRYGISIWSDGLDGHAAAARRAGVQDDAAVGGPHGVGRYRIHQ